MVGHRGVGGLQTSYPSLVRAAAAAAVEALAGVLHRPGHSAALRAVHLRNQAGRRWPADKLRLIAVGNWVSPVERQHGHGKLITLRDSAGPWLADRTLKPRTREHYQALLHHQILPALGEKPLRAITPVTVRTWHAEQGSGTLTLRAHAYALLRTILGSAVHDGLIPCHIRQQAGAQDQAGDAGRARGTGCEHA
jgi:Phage integrase, N-terminal SAM-like domain